MVFFEEMPLKDLKTGGSSAEGAILYVRVRHLGSLKAKL
jgi:hypothetical protein